MCTEQKHNANRFYADLSNNEKNKLEHNRKLLFKHVNQITKNYTKLILTWLFMLNTGASVATLAFIGVCLQYKSVITKFHGLPLIWSLITFIISTLIVVTLAFIEYYRFEYSGKKYYKLYDQFFSGEISYAEFDTLFQRNKGNALYWLSNIFEFLAFILFIFGIILAYCDLQRVALLLQTS